MTKKSIATDTLFAKWRKDPAYVKAYDAADAEFSMAAALIEARARADLSQAELAKRMGTTQSAIARLESGKFNPSHETLQKFAKATGTRVRVVFEPGFSKASP